MKHKDFAKDKLDKIETLIRTTQQLIKRGGNRDQVNEFLDVMQNEVTALTERINLED